ncbi:membrane protein [Vitreoscilla filiformis]|jgi:predicted negative regulator of RcsB-dependent stress response|uniref:Ancillary SecYEG translocon subunit n=1 Tax=Vitreoscilla filiformis TaxID=63 RepID=A0A221KHH3_VITFI|nr:tetratricopeptide repeat protein [Vitreoscilla filiformis]ASM78504.1 membrane protein [Vitreoscilla filiformis]
MASNLDLQEQEQLDELKAFWNQYGNLITWVITLVLAGFAAWNGWNWWQREQATKATAMFDELEQAAQAKDVPKVQKVFGDLKERFGGTAVAGQGGLLAARVLVDGGQADPARAALDWVAQNAHDEGHRQVAHLRLAGLLLDQKSYDDALKHLDAVTAPDFTALAQDRRGDVLQAQGKTAEAVKAWTAAWTALPDRLEYRRVIKAKLTAQGAEPQPASVTVKEAS